MIVWDVSFVLVLMWVTVVMLLVSNEVMLFELLLMTFMIVLVVLIYLSISYVVLLYSVLHMHAAAIALPLLFVYVPV